MFINSDYCSTADIYSTKPCKTLADVGISFEFEVNRELMNLDAFVLYYDVGLFIKKEIKWTLGGNFFTADNPDDTMDITKKKQIDHLLITPCAVFVLESKNYSSQCTYTRANGKLYKKGGEELTDPFVQAKIYGAIIRQILRYYEVDLPVIAKGLFKNEIMIMNDKDNDDFILFHKLLSFIEKQSVTLPRKPMDAIKLCKSLYFDRCHPIAYDGNIYKW